MAPVSVSYWEQLMENDCNPELFIQNNKYSEMFQLWKGSSPVDWENSLKKKERKKGKNK